VARSRAKSCRWSTPGTPRSFVVRREPSQSQTPVPLEVLRRAYRGEDTKVHRLSGSI
jgi:hypothetical protein